MKQITAVLFILCLLGHLTAQEPGHRGPRIACDEKGWDFGEVNQGVRDKKTIKIRNTGDEVLTISDIKVTCGCVQATMAQKSIPPGESRDLVLTLSTYRAYGRIRKHCYIYSNAAGRKGPLILTIDGDVKADWWIDNRQIQFGRLPAGEAHQQQFRILSRQKRPLDIVSITSRNPNVDIAYKRISRDAVVRPVYLVTITLKETLPPGPFADAIAVRVRGRKTPMQTVMVYARMEGSVRVKPLKVFMGRIYFDQVGRKVVRFSLDEGYSIIEAKGSRASIKTEILEVPGETAWDIEIYVTGRKSEMNMDEYLEITTDHPIQPRIRIPVNWVSRPPRR